ISQRHPTARVGTRQGWAFPNQRWRNAGDTSRKGSAGAERAGDYHSRFAEPGCDPFSQDQGSTSVKAETSEQLLRAVETLWQQHPDWRLGQLICNVAGWADVDVWDVEDEQLLQAIRKQQEYQQSSASPR